MSHYLVTGGCGFLGTWIVKRLFDAGDTVTVLDVQEFTRRWELILSQDEIARIGFESIQIEDTAQVAGCVERLKPDGIIHLAGLQVPACRENPVRGAMVNVIGTLNIFEAIRALRKSQPNARPAVVYASSAAVFGPDAEYPDGPVNDSSLPRPTNHYGAYKLCNEHSAKAYFLTDGIASVGLRPLTVYGPGRDFGMTSYPTRAIAAALLKRPYEIPFTGATAYIHAREVADMFVRCVKAPCNDARVYTVGGDVADTATYLNVLERVLPGAKQFIKATGGNLPITERLDDGALRRDYPGLLRVELEQGLRETVDVFKRMAALGRLEECLGK